MLTSVIKGLDGTQKSPFFVGAKWHATGHLRSSLPAGSAPRGRFLDVRDRDADRDARRAFGAFVSMFGEARKLLMGVKGAKSVLLWVALSIVAGTAPASAREPWQFRLSPYAWLAGVNGTVGTIPGQPAVPVDVSARDALSDLEGGAMIMLDARKGRHGFLADLLYTNVQSDTELLPPPIGLNLESISKTTIATLAYQYELFRQDETVVDALAGLRYWKMDSELRFGGGLGFLAGRSIRNKESWVDPAVGVKGRAPLGSSRFYFEAGAGVGGFGVGSDLFYEINVNVGYQWSKSIGTTIGYRMFDVDYENDGYVYDVRQQGWQLGLTWSF